MNEYFEKIAEAAFADELEKIAEGLTGGNAAAASIVGEIVGPKFNKKKFKNLADKKTGVNRIEKSAGKTGDLADKYRVVNNDLKESYKTYKTKRNKARNVGNAAGLLGLASGFGGSMSVVNGIGRMDSGFKFGKGSKIGAGVGAAGLIASSIISNKNNKKKKAFNKEYIKDINKASDRYRKNRMASGLSRDESNTAHRMAKYKTNAEYDAL